MIARVLFVLYFIGIAAGSAAQPTYPQNLTSDPDVVGVVFHNANIQIDPNTHVDSGMVVIEGRSILYSGESKEWPDSAQFVWHDLKGNFIYPGFIDPYSHAGVSKPKPDGNDGPQPESKVDGAKSWNDAIKPQASAFEKFRSDEEEMKKLRNAGFSIVSTHIPDGIIRGTSMTLATGDEHVASQTLTPHSTLHYSFDKGSSTQDYPTSLMGAIALLRQTFYDTEWYQKGGRKEEGNASLEALSNRMSLPQIAEADHHLEVLNWIDIAKEFEMDFTIKSNGSDYRILRELHENNVRLIVPLDFPKPYDVNDPDLTRALSTADLRHWKRAPFNPRYLYETGVQFAFTADGLDKPGMFLDKLREAYRHGLPESAALAAITTVPAEILKIEDRAGTLEKGKLANLIISDGPILAEKASIEAHYVMGKRYELLEVRKKERLPAEYSLNTGEGLYDLTLSEKKGKFRAKAVPEGDSTAIDVNFSVFEGQVSLSFKDTISNPSKYVSLAGGIFGNGRIWSGSGTVAGKSTEWSAIAKKPYVAEPITLESPDPSLGLPRLPAPLTSYGYDSLPTQESTLFINATLWTSDSLGKIKNGQILIHEGRILEVDTDIDTLLHFPNGTPDGFRIVNLGGRHVTPGIIDEHSHIAIRRGVNEAGQANTAEVRIRDAVDPTDINIYRQLAGGVTTSQLLHGSANPIGGQSAIIKMRWGQSADSMIFDEAPPFIKFALGENVKQSNWGDEYDERFPQTRMGVEQAFYDAFWQAREYSKSLEKRLGESRDKRRKRKVAEDPFRKNLELEAISEILAGRRYITCHSYVQSEMEMLMSVADSMGFTVNTFTHVLEGYKIAEELAAHGAGGSTFSDWWAYKFEVRDAIPYNAALMARAGVLTAINSDNAEMGRRLNQEAAKAVKYGGLSEEEALKLITINPARMLHIEDYTGSLKAGKHADLVIWEGHPLSLNAHPKITIIDGVRYFDRNRNKELFQELKQERARLLEEMANEGKKGKTQPVSKEENELYHCESR